MAVDELLIGRPGRGVVVQPRALDPRPVTFGRRVVEAQEDPLARPDDVYGLTQQAGGNGSGLASEAVEEVVIVGEVLADADRPQPTGDGASAAGEEYADE